VLGDTPRGCPIAMSSSSDEPDSRSRRSSIFGFLFVLVVAVVAMAFLFGGFFPFGFPQSQPSSPPVFELVFSRVGIDDGRNASWIVDSVDGGPYTYTGFSVRLAVNGGSTLWAPLGRNDTIHSVVVGMVTYRIMWHDSDGNGFVSKGDSFSVTGDRAQLPSESTFEFGLKWLESWISHAFWSTS